jgi:hypothetical protein
MVSESAQQSVKPPIPPPTFAAPPSRARAKRIIIRLIWAGVILVVLVRIALPFVVQSVLQRSLSRMLETTVQIKDVDLSLLRGAVWIQGLRIRGPEGFQTHEPIELKELGVNVKVWSLLGKTLTIQRVAVKNPLLVLERNSQGDIGVVRLIEQMSKEEAPPPKPTPSRAPAIRIKSITVKNGKIVFVDHQADDQPLATAISELNARVRNLRPATPESQMPTTYKLTARLLDKPDARLNIEGKGDFLSNTLSMDTQLVLERLALVHFAPYYAGSPLEIRNGFVSAETHAVCQHNILNMPIQITFSEMDVGVRTRMAMRKVFGLPARLVVAFFTSPEGTVPITAHVSGNVRDPQFNLEQTIARAVSQAMQNKILQLRDVDKLDVDTGIEILESALESGKETLKAAPGELKKGTRNIGEHLRQIIPGKKENED